MAEFMELRTQGIAERFGSGETYPPPSGPTDMTASAWRRLNRNRDHRWAQARISDYLEGGLPARQHRRLADHEDLCPECERLIRTLEVLLAVLPSLRLPATTALAVGERTAERVRAQIEEWS